MDIQLNVNKDLILKGQVYAPAKNSKKVILMVHGIGEHIGRYNHWAERFAQEGIAFAGIDLPGHGLSPGRRGHIKNYHVYNEIIDSLAGFVKNEFGDIPTGLYGHSLGGNIVLNYLLNNTSNFDFAVITSPWIKLTEEPSKAKVAVARLVNHIFPGLLQPSGLVLKHLSRVSDVNMRYKNDPLVHDRISVRLGVEAIDAAERIIGYRNKIELPVLLLHGEDDKITSPGGSKLFADGKPNVTLKIWDNGYHELHNESFNDELFEFIYEWLNKL